MERVEVVPVDSASRERAFLDLPYRLHRGDPAWVAPLRRSERLRWKPGHNATLRRRPHARFLAMVEGRAAGRIAAIDDRAFSRWDDAGFFGFLDCEPREDVALPLLGAAGAWLRARGRRRILGPVDGSTHDEVGLLVDAFEAPPRVLCPWHPPGLEALLLAAGFRGERDYLAYEWTDDAPRSAAVERLTRRLRSAASGIRVRPADDARFDEEADTLRALYNESFAGVWGFVPIERDEFRERAVEFRAFYRPDLVRIAERDGQAVGFALLLPDVYRALAPLRGRLLPFGWLRLALGIRRIREARFVLLGVLPGLAGEGVGVALARAAVDAVTRAGIRRCEISLVQETNSRMVRVIEAFGCRRSKTYRLFGRDLRGDDGA
jgi:GNAT superfamily N-acetyltransferase